MNVFKYSAILLILTTTTTYSFINYSDSVTTDSRLLLLDSVITNYRIVKCCNSTIEKCIINKPACSIAPRFYNFTCWLIMREDNYDAITLQLDKRYISFFGPDTFSIASSYIPPAGDAAAPIVITAYISASCNLCKKVCIPLHMAVTEGPVKGMAMLRLKPSTVHIGDRAFMAAAKMGKFWEFFLSLENVKKRLDEKFLIKKAKKLGLNTALFEKYLYDEKLIAELKNIQEEALSNGAKISPTLFINNRRYQSYKNPQWIIDVVEYEYERINSPQRGKRME